MPPRRGAFPLFDRDAYLAGESVRALDDDVRAAIARHGIRNALITSIAPTGTISLLADNVSSGLEPVFSFNYTRNILMPDGTRKSEEVSDFAYRLFRKLHGADAKLPDYFVDAQSLTPPEHVVMQAAVQRYIDSSISKTINCPADLAFERLQGYLFPSLRARLQGLHDLSAERRHRRGARDPQARRECREPELDLPAPAARPADLFEAGGVVYMTQPLSRPEALPGQTYKIRWPDSDHAMYITLNDIVQDGRRRPFEVFINSKNMDHYAWTVALTRMISAVFRRGGDVSFVSEELKAVFDPRGGAWMNGRYVPSLLGRDRRRDRAAYDRHRHAAGQRPSRPGRRAPQGRQSGDQRPAPMPEMRPGLAGPPGRLRQLHELRLLALRVSPPGGRPLLKARPVAPHGHRSNFHQAR